MEIPVRFAGLRTAGCRVLGVFLAGALLASCAGLPPQFAPAGLDAPGAKFSNGRLTVELVDENGTPMRGYKVDFSWQQPDFYKTSAFTNSLGQVTVAGVPEVAAISIDYEGGQFEQTIFVPQKGRSDFRVMVDTRGEYEARRFQQEEQLRFPAGVVR